MPTYNIRGTFKASFVRDEFGFARKKQFLVTEIILYVLWSYQKFVECKGKFGICGRVLQFPLLTITKQLARLCFAENLLKGVLKVPQELLKTSWWKAVFRAFPGNKFLK